MREAFFGKSGAILLGGLAIAMLVIVPLTLHWQPFSTDGALVSSPIAQIANPQRQGEESTKSIGASASSKAKKTPNYLSTSGSKIVDSDGNSVRLTGVNWFGMETQTFSPHGLWLRKWQDMLDQIASSGFNTIRLPFASTVMDPNARPMEGIDYELNPDLRGLTALEIMDKIVEGAGERGLKIILDRHRPNTDAQSKLWYTDFLPEEQWIADWQTLAKRYLGNDAVIGADLHNEPAGDAKWGTGEPRTDWRAAAERAGNAILDVNPNWLIIVEGVEKVGNDGYWMGGNLAAAGASPVNLKVPNKLVYSTHDYGPGVYDQEWFKDRSFPANLPEIWHKHWAYLVEENIAPVLVGEFGGKSVSTKDREGIWQRALFSYMQERDISFTYWSFNPNSVDTGGILEDDWKTVNREKGNLVSSYLSPKLAVNLPSVIDRNAVSVGSRKNALPAQPVKVQLAVGDSDSKTDRLSLKLSILNQTGANVPLPQLELRYWLSAAEAALSALANPESHLSAEGTGVAINWASTGGARASVIADSGIPYLRVGFDKGAGTLPGFGKVEVHVQVARPDKIPFVQSSHYSFKSFNAPTDNDSIGLYYWGDRVWGNEPSKGTAGQDPTPPDTADGSAAESASGGVVAGATTRADEMMPYVVRPGDTLRSIARDAYGDPEAWKPIADANPGQVRDPDLILPGQDLLLPPH